jgi:hypothetical protein
VLAALFGVTGHGSRPLCCRRESFALSHRGLGLLCSGDDRSLRRSAPNSEQSSSRGKERPGAPLGVLEKRTCGERFNPHQRPKRKRRRWHLVFRSAVSGCTACARFPSSPFSLK